MFTTLRSTLSRKFSNTPGSSIPGMGGEIKATCDLFSYFRGIVVAALQFLFLLSLLCAILSAWPMTNMDLFFVGILQVEERIYHYFGSKIKSLFRS